MTANHDRLRLPHPWHNAYGDPTPAGRAVINLQRRALELIRTVEPEVHVAFFPVEQEYVVHVWGRDLSGMHPTRGAALADALDRLNLTI